MSRVSVSAFFRGSLRRNEVAAGRVLRVPSDHQMTLGTLYVVDPQANPLPLKVRAFSSHLREHVPRIFLPRAARVRPPDDRAFQSGSS